MSPTEIQMIVDRLASIEKRLNETVTWKTLFAGLAACAALVTAAVTAGNAMWG